MYPTPIQRLISHFQKLPGIGPKQAAKFAFKAIEMHQEELDLFSKDLAAIREETASCSLCALTYEKDGEDICPICRNDKRSHSHICVVETERDARTIEKSNTFSGVYHILGEKVSLSGSSISPKAISTLEARLKKSAEDTEVILAMNATTAGQTEALYLERALAPLNKKITHLGRGLSSGIEIEYADKDTLVDAFQNRK